MSASPCDQNNQVLVQVAVLHDLSRVGVDVQDRVVDGVNCQHGDSKSPELVVRGGHVLVVVLGVLEPS